MEHFQSIFGKHHRRGQFFEIKMGNGMQLFCKLKNLNWDWKGEER